MFDKLKGAANIVTLLVYAGLGVINIFKAIGGNGTADEKKAAVKAELDKVSGKLSDLAAATDVKWDDAVADVFGKLTSVLAELAVLFVKEPA